MSLPRVSRKKQKATTFSQRNFKKRTRKVDTKQKKQLEELLRESGTKVRIKALIDWKERRGAEWHLRQNSKTRERFAESVRTSPMERTHNLHGIRFWMLQATSSKYRQAELLEQQRFPLLQWNHLSHYYPFILALFKKTVVNKRKITLCLRLLSSQTHMYDNCSL